MKVIMGQQKLVSSQFHPVGAADLEAKVFLTDTISNAGAINNRTGYSFFGWSWELQALCVSGNAHSEARGAGRKGRSW